MPESPEVQALVEFLDERMSGRAVAGIEDADPRALKTRERPLAGLIGARIAAVRRHGKHLALDTDAGWLVVSFGRNGWIRWNPDDGVPAGAVQRIARVVLDDGARADLVETGDFLAVGLWVVDEPKDVAAIAALGPDPLAPDFAPDALERALGPGASSSRLCCRSSVRSLGSATPTPTRSCIAHVCRRRSMPLPCPGLSANASSRRRSGSCAERSRTAEGFRLSVSSRRRSRR